MSLLAYHRSLQTLDGFGGDTGSGPPSTFKSVIFRALNSPLTQSPVVTLNEMPVPGPGGQYRDVANLSNWTTAMANAVPGDVIRIVNSLPGAVQARGSKYNIPGINMVSSPLGGADGNPIIITCADENVFIDPGNTSNNLVGLDLVNTNHVHAIRVNVKRSQFGIRTLNLEGSAANPFRVAHCHVENIGHSAYAFQGWWQPITSSGGTPLPGAGNEMGFTKHGIVEYNLSTATGQIDTHGGESFYFGAGGGSSPTGFVGWYGWASDILVRGNMAENFTSDGYDIKPGSRRLQLLHNVARNGASDGGAFINGLYVSNEIDFKPSWMEFDPEIYIEQNILYDLNLSKIQSPTTPWLVYYGQSGIRYANNIHFAWDQGVAPYNPAIYIRIDKPEAEFGTHESWIRNNLFWGRGVQNAGYSPGPTPITLGSWFKQENNIYPVGYSGGEHTAAVNGSDFEGTVPSPGTLGTAEDGSSGPGSSFDLLDSSSLQGVGTVFDVSNLWLEEDISQREIPTISSSVNPNPGPFQPFSSSSAFSLVYEKGAATQPGWQQATVDPWEANVNIDSVNGDWTPYGSALGSGLFDGNNGWGGRRHETISGLVDGVDLVEIRAFQSTGAHGADAPGVGQADGIMLHGGMKLRSTNNPRPITYGRVRVRARCSVDPDEVTSGILLLWPQTDIKGFEINVFENFAHRDDRNPIQTFLHYGNGIPQVQYEHTGLSTADWHDYELIWTPDIVSVQIIDTGEDARVLATSAANPERIPNEPMEVALQLDGWPDPAIGSPDVGTYADHPVISAGNTVKLQIAYLSVEQLIL